MKNFLSVVFTVVLVMQGSALGADLKESINIGGAVGDSMGNPIAQSLAYRVQFYDAVSGGVQIGSDSIGTVTPESDGSFNVAIVPPAGIADATDSWYELALDTNDDGIDANDVFGTRVPIHAVPFAINAKQLNGVAASVYVTSTTLAVALADKSDATHTHDLMDLNGAVTDAQVPNDIAIDQATDALKLAGTDAVDYATDTEVAAALANKSDATHTHDLQNLGGAVTDAQVPNDITIEQATNALRLAGTDAVDYATDTEVAAALADKSDATHTHNLQDLGGAVTDAQVPDDVTIDQATNALTLAGTAAVDYATDTEVATALAGKANTVHAHNLQDLGGAVTDAQVPNNITITEADTLNTVTGRGATTSTQVTLSGGVKVDTISENTATNGVTIDGVKAKDSYVELSTISAPSPTTGRLYNTGGNLFWNGTQLGTGGGGGDVDTITISYHELSTFDNNLYIWKQNMKHNGTIVSVQVFCQDNGGAGTIDVRKGGSTILSSTVALPNNSVTEANVTTPAFSIGNELSIFFTGSTSDSFKTTITIIVQYS